MLRKTSSLLTISVMIILNAACTQLQVENSDNVIGTQIPPTPTPIQSIASSDEVNSTPTVESSPTSIATDLKNTSMNICFLYIVETEEQLGGMPSSFDSVYIHKDGTIQQTREKNDDTIQLLREGRVDTSDVLRDFSNIELPLLDIAEQENDGVTISEYSEPTVQI